MLRLWDREKQCFVIKGKDCWMTSDDVCLILGLSSGAECIHTKPKIRTSDAAIFKKYFEGTRGKIITRHIQEKIEDIIRSELPADDLGSCICMLICQNFLFQSLVQPMSTNPELVRELVNLYSNEVQAFRFLSVTIRFTSRDVALILLSRLKADNSAHGHLSRKIGANQWPPFRYYAANLADYPVNLDLRK